MSTMTRASTRKPVARAASGLAVARAQLLIQRADQGFCGGERGIRTPGDREATTVFKTDAIVRSAISPLTRLAILANEFAEYDFSDKDQQHGQLQLIDYGEWRNE